MYRFIYTDISRKKLTGPHRHQLRRASPDWPKPYHVMPGTDSSHRLKHHSQHMSVRGFFLGNTSYREGGGATKQEGVHVSE